MHNKVKAYRKTPLVIITICLLFFLSIKIANAQDVSYLSHHINSEQGLPDKEIYGIVEDNDGFIWVATNSGLYRYDGVNFKLYRHKNQDKSSVFNLTLDDKGRLWFNTINGEYFYVLNDEVEFFKAFTSKTNEILRAFSVINNSLYILFNDKITAVNINTKKEKYYNFKFNKRTSISSVVNYKDSLYLVDSKQRFKLKESNQGIKNEDYRVSPKVAISESGMIVHNIVNGNKNQFNLIKDSKSTIFLKGLTEVEETTLHHFKILDKFLWIFTSKGAYKYSLDKEFCQLKDVFLKGKDVSDAIIDSEGNLYFTTLSYGIYVFPNLSLKMVEIKQKDINITEFEAVNDSVIAYIEAKERLIKLNIVNSKKEERVLKNYNQKLFYDKVGEQLYVFVNNQVFIQDIKNKISNYKKIKLGKPKDIIRLNNNELLLSHYNKLKVVETTNFSEKNYFVGRCNKLDFNSNNNMLFVDFSKGLKMGKNINALKTVEINGNKIYAKSIAVRPNTDTTLVATHNNKIVLFNNSKAVGNISIPKNYTISNLGSDNTNLWIGTDKGILRYNYNSNTKHKLKNIPELQINTIEFTNKNVWLATDTKIYIIPKSYKENRNNTPILPYFSQVLIGDNEVKFQEPILVKDRNQSLSATFMINGFKKLEDYYFEYKLSQNNWQSISGNTLVLSNLSYGSQTLSVRAVNNETGVKSNFTSLNLTVLSPFYYKWWFLMISLLLFIALLYLTFKYYINQLNKKKKKELLQSETKRHLTNLQLENLRSQMNPHFIFNALNSIQEYIFTNEKKLASSYLVKFSRLIRIYLEQSRLSEITLVKEIEALGLYLELENNRFGNQLNYSVDVDEDLNLENTFVPSLFIQPYVENAIKHGLLHKKGEKNLLIKFKRNRTNNEMIVTIKDNGIGRKASIRHNENRPYKSFSTEANLNRIELINAKRSKKLSVKFNDLTDEIDNALGTEVIITIPLTK